jgi:methylglutamate dehydrogenase subunit D
VVEGVHISVRSDLALAALIVRRGRLDTLRAAMRDAWDVELPLSPRVSEGNGVNFIWAGPERWLVAAPALAPDELVGVLRARAEGLAAVCDQSDSRILLRVSGCFARDALAKGLPVDLDPTVFPVGSTAITMAAEIGCQLWQVDDAPTFDLAVPRSFAASFRHWLAVASAGFSGAGT